MALCYTSISYMGLVLKYGLFHGCHGAKRVCFFKTCLFLNVWRTSDSLIWSVTVHQKASSASQTFRTGFLVSSIQTLSHAVSACFVCREPGL
mmetsp:Transcript_16790/g.24686  ORF Transcript_16790/g.24686 Transcript_16790/m.24686 type:complete len:92 (-) Transcript_16790:135-410(-)